MDVFEKCAEIIKAQKEIYYNAYEDGKASAGGGDGYEEGFEAGKQAEYDAFWDAFQSSGSRKNYSYAFYNPFWSDANFKPKYSFEGMTQATYMFCYSTVSEIDVTVDLSGVGGTSTYVFAFDRNLKKILVLKVSAQTIFKNWFNECSELTTMTVQGEIAQNGFDIHWSTKLNKASITSIINALSTTTTGLSITLSLTAVNNAFEGGSTGTEWTTLAGTKSNWTINLV